MKLRLALISLATAAALVVGIVPSVTVSSATRVPSGVHQMHPDPIGRF